MRIHRRGGGKGFQFLVGQRDKQQAVAAGEAANAVDHQRGACGVGEIGKDDDERAPLEPLRQCCQRQREIGLARFVVQRGGGAEQAVKMGGRGDERRGQLHPRGKAEQCGTVAALERDIGGGERGGNSAIKPRQAAHRVAHRLTAIKREDDLVVALGLVFAGIQMGVAGGNLPVDAAAIHAGLVFGQGFKRGAFAA